MKYNIVLLFPPFSAFSYIPSGLYGLEAFIKANHPGIFVTTIDLNNHFLEKKVTSDKIHVLSQLCSICPEAKTGCQKLLRNKVNFSKKLTFVRSLRIGIKKYESLIIGDAKYYEKSIFSFDVFFKEIQSCLEKQIASYFRKPQKAIVHVFYNIFREEIETVIAQKPSLVGISVFTQDQFLMTMMLTVLIKERTAALIVLGGAFISILNPEEILKAIPSVDCIVYNEGELGLLGLLRSFNNSSFSDVPNLVYRNGEKIVRTSAKNLYSMDTLPYLSIKTIPFHRYLLPRPVLAIGFSRGCYWRKCRFCSMFKGFGKTYKMKSPARFVDEIVYYYQHGIRNFIFNDESFPAAQLNTISKAIIRKKLKIQYFFLARPTRDYTPSVLNNIYNSGGRFVFWGVESGSQRMLDLINKGTESVDVARLLRQCEDIGFNSIAGIMKGIPGATKKDHRANIQFLRDLEPYVYRYSLAKFRIEKSYMLENSKKFGILNIRPIVLLRVGRDRMIHSYYFNFDYKNDRDRYYFEKLEKIENKLNIIQAVSKKYIEHLLIQLAG